MELKTTTPDQRTPPAPLPPISRACIPDEATDWRCQAADALNGRGPVFLCYRSYPGIETLDSMHAKKDSASHDADKAAFNDVKRCDALLVNLLGVEEPSIDTIRLLTWAYALQKPAVVAIEKSGNPHDLHPLVQQVIPFRVETLDEAIEATAVILNR